MTDFTLHSSSQLSKFDRAAILRSAHALVRYRIAHDRVTRPYRQMLAQALREEWCCAKMAAEEAAASAAETVIELPADVEARCSSLRLEASYEPHTFAGHDRFKALHAEADKLENGWGIAPKRKRKILHLPKVRTELARMRNLTERDRQDRREREIAESAAEAATRELVARARERLQRENAAGDRTWPNNRLAASVITQVVEDGDTLIVTYDRLPAQLAFVGA